MNLGGGGSKGVQLTAEEMELLMMGGLGGDLPALPGSKALGGDDSGG